MGSIPTEIEHPELFHYTNFAGLEGILNSQSLWATHYLSLNDSTEIKLFADKLKQILAPVARNLYISMVVDGRIKIGSVREYGGIEEVSKHDAKSFVDACLKSLDDQIYLVSFCGTSRDSYVRQNGLLSQWRAYGKEGGFCLQFDCKALIDLLGKEANKYAHVVGHCSDMVYSDNEEYLFKEFKAELEIAEEYLKQMLTRIRDDKIPDAGNFLPAFVSCLTRYKHRAFKEEQEVRVVWVPMSENDFQKMDKTKFPNLSFKPKKFRGPDNAIPYMDLLSKSDSNLPIERVIVGPQNDQEQAAEKVKVICEPLGIKVELSEIPYVSR